MSSITASSQLGENMNLRAQEVWDIVRVGGGIPVVPGSRGEALGTMMSEVALGDVFEGPNRATLP